jgi:hypothetical protein
MPFSVIDKGSKYFTAVTYTANASTQNITGLLFQPDFVWTKSRANAYNHNNYDVIRGATVNLGTNQTRAEGTDVNSLSSFNTDGFTLKYNEDSNYTNGSTAVAWCWKANGTGVSNTAGTISSTVSANTTAGFSIVSYTGNGSTSATVGHGLGVIPAMIIIKNRSAVSQWLVKHKSLATDYNLQLNVTDAQVYLPSGTGQGGVGNLSSSSTFGFTSGTTGVNNVNNSGSSFIAYCFAEVKGYSKFGSYTGNGSTDGTYVHLGFTPAFIMYKNSGFAGTSWAILDNKRNTYNVANLRLFADSSSAEDGTNMLDILSNGFKARSTNDGVNRSGNTIIYMAFAENPFVSSKGIPACAR